MSSMMVVNISPRSWGSSPKYNVVIRLAEQKTFGLGSELAFIYYNLLYDR